MGKGDKRSKKGKIILGSYGVSRPRIKRNPKFIPTKKTAPKVVEMVETVKVKATPKIVEVVETAKVKATPKVVETVEVINQVSVQETTAEVTASKPKKTPAAKKVTAKKAVESTSAETVETAPKPKKAPAKKKVAKGEATEKVVE